MSKTLVNHSILFGGVNKLSGNSFDAINRYYFDKPYIVEVGLTCSFPVAPGSVVVKLQNGAMSELYELDDFDPNAGKVVRFVLEDDMIQVSLSAASGVSAMAVDGTLNVCIRALND